MKCHKMSDKNTADNCNKIARSNAIRPTGNYLEKTEQKIFKIFQFTRSNV